MKQQILTQTVASFVSKCWEHEKFHDAQLDQGCTLIRGNPCSVHVVPTWFTRGPHVAGPRKLKLGIWANYPPGPIPSACTPEVTPGVKVHGLIRAEHLFGEITWLVLRSWRLEIKPITQDPCPVLVLMEVTPGVKVHGLIRAEHLFGEITWLVLRSWRLEIKPITQDPGPIPSAGNIGSSIRSQSARLDQGCTLIRKNPGSVHVVPTWLVLGSWRLGFEPITQDPCPVLVQPEVAPGIKVHGLIWDAH
jgi:hypothetical protein